jgi:hypothetical protein
MCCVLKSIRSQPIFKPKTKSSDRLKKERQQRKNHKASAREKLLAVSRYADLLEDTYEG